MDCAMATAFCSRRTLELRDPLLYRLHLSSLLFDFYFSAQFPTISVSRFRCASSYLMSIIAKLMNSDLNESTEDFLIWA